MLDVERVSEDCWKQGMNEVVEVGDIVVDVDVVFGLKEVVEPVVVVVVVEKKRKSEE